MSKNKRAPTVIGFIRWVEDGNEMVPYKTTDDRLVVFETWEAAEVGRGYMHVISPLTKAEVADLSRRFELKTMYRVDYAEALEHDESADRSGTHVTRIKRPDAKPLREPSKRKRRKASQSKRKAAQSDAKPKQLSLF
jgi:hypothetical protein